MRVTLIDADVPVFSRPDGASPPLAKLKSGTEIDLGKLIKSEDCDWVEAVFGKSRRGYIRGATRIFEIRPATLDQDRADLFERPSFQGARKGRLTRGQALSLIATVPGDKGDWVRVRDSRGVEGFIHGQTKIQKIEREAQPAGAPAKTAKSWSYYMRQGLLEIVLGLIASLILYMIPKKFPGKGYMMWGTIIPGAWTVARGGWLWLRRNKNRNQ